MNLKYSVQCIIVIFTIFVYVKSQTDSYKFIQLRRQLIGPLQKTQDIRKSKHLIQTLYPETTSFFCDGKMGPGKRSSTRPTSVHQLQPGDIDIIMAMGDSITVGNGLIATNLFHVLIENRGLAWSIGGQGNWRKFITLPNIFKEFNPNLYGYSLNSSITVDRASRLNVAEGGAMSRDMPYQAQVLINRLKHDPKINMQNDWKVLTLMIGANDFCGDICYHKEPKIIVNNHKRELLKTLRILRNNIPRLFVNLVLPPNVAIIRQLTNTPLQCYFSHRSECACFTGEAKKNINYFTKIIEDWLETDYEIAYQPEFNTKDFTVSVQPFTTAAVLPRLKNGLIDYSYFSVDCFHFSQKLHKIMSINLWNNMLEPEGNKSKITSVKDTTIKCPTKEMPFLRTRENSNIRNILTYEN